MDFKVPKTFVATLIALALLAGGATYSLAADFAADAEAQLVPCGTKSTPPCTWADLVKLANNIVNFLVFISSMLGVIAFCYAGFLYITAAGDGGKIEQAHHIFKMVVIGIFFVLGGWLLIATILKVLVGDSDTAGINSFIDFGKVDTIQTTK